MPLWIWNSKYALQCFDSKIHSKSHKLWLMTIKKRTINKKPWPDFTFQNEWKLPKIIKTQEQQLLDPNEDILGPCKTMMLQQSSISNDQPRLQLWNSEIWIYFPWIISVCTTLSNNFRFHSAMCINTLSQSCYIEQKTAIL